MSLTCPFAKEYLIANVAKPLENRYLTMQWLNTKTFDEFTDRNEMIMREAHKASVAAMPKFCLAWRKALSKNRFGAIHDCAIVLRERVADGFVRKWQTCALVFLVYNVFIRPSNYTQLVEVPFPNQFAWCTVLRTSLKDQIRDGHLCVEQLSAVFSESLLLRFSMFHSVQLIKVVSGTANNTGHRPGKTRNKKIRSQPPERSYIDVLPTVTLATADIADAARRKLIGDESEGLETLHRLTAVEHLAVFVSQAEDASNTLRKVLTTPTLYALWQCHLFAQYERAGYYGDNNRYIKHMRDHGDIAEHFEPLHKALLQLDAQIDFLVEKWYSQQLFYAPDNLVVLWHTIVAQMINGLERAVRYARDN